jgi:hypothetical protein
MEASRINVKARNFRGGYTIVRYTITCECGCSEKAFAEAFKSDEKMTEDQVREEILNIHSIGYTIGPGKDLKITLERPVKPKQKVKSDENESPDKDS